jgi:hypothetical protein
MQPEVAPFGYAVLEGMVVLASLALAYFSWRVMTTTSLPKFNHEGTSKHA